MFLLIRIWRFLWLLLLCSAGSACANPSCVFDEGVFSEDRYSNNPKIESYTWDKARKEAKGVTKAGALFTVKHWACRHYGTHAMMFLGPYGSDENKEDVEKQLDRLVDIALDGTEAELADGALKGKTLMLQETVETIRVNIEEYSEFYMSYGAFGEVRFFEIKFYRD